jgi:hypothetical protein
MSGATKGMTEPGPLVIVPPRNDSAVILQIIERAATSPDFDIDRLQKLLELKTLWDAREAQKAFTVAMAEFKRNPPQIFKDRHVDYGAGKAKFDYATHSEIVSKVIPALAAHGFSHKWITTAKPDWISVRCVLTHSLGHSEEIEMGGPPDTAGTKNPNQAIQATSTYWQRNTLLAITGLSAADLPDLDEGAKPELPPDVVTALKDAAREGTAALAACFKDLSEQTRARIVADYSQEWDALKADAAKVAK